MDPTVAKLCELKCGRMGREANRLIRMVDGSAEKLRGAGPNAVK